MPPAVCVCVSVCVCVCVRVRAHVRARCVKAAFSDYHLYPDDVLIYLCVCVCVCLSPGQADMMFSSGVFWTGLVFIPTTSLVFDVAYKV